MFNSLKEGYEKKCHTIIKKSSLYAIDPLSQEGMKWGGGIKSYFVASRIAISSAEI